MFCAKCGNQLDDAAMICPKCGVPTANFKKAQQAQNAQQTVHVNVDTGDHSRSEGSSINPATLKKIGGVFLLLGGISTVLNGLTAGDILYLIIGTVVIAGGSCLLAWGIYGSD